MVGEIDLTLQMKPLFFITVKLSSFLTMNIFSVIIISGSPWSTPTQSEIGEAESQLKYLSDIDLKLGVEHKLMVRELGDGEPSENSVTEIEDRPGSNFTNI